MLNKFHNTHKIFSVTHKEIMRIIMEEIIIATQMFKIKPRDGHNIPRRCHNNFLSMTHNAYYVNYAVVRIIVLYSSP